jgi:hypothetical protein
MKIPLCLAVSFVVTGCGFFASTALTQVNLDRIHNEMSAADVKSILGDPATSESEANPLVGGVQTIYTYRSKSSEVTILFKNDGVKEKHGTFGR